MKVPIDKIIIGPRQRIDLGDIETLMESLRDNGQMHNIGLTLDYRLVWGRRRLEAAKRLGWTDIEAVVRPDLTPLQEQLLEFEEDMNRKDRTWQEQCLAVRKVDAFYRREKNRGNLPNWSTRALTKVVGQSNMSLNYMLRIAEQLAVEPRDEEIWALDGWWPAVQLILKRQLVPIDAERDRRNGPPVNAEGVQVCAKCKKTYPDHIGEEHPFLAWTELDPNATTEPASASGTGPVQDLAKNLIVIQGHRRPFEDVASSLASCSLVLAYGYKGSDHHIANILRPGGYAVLWSGHWIVEGLDEQPFHLVWNKINVSSGVWPFSENYVQGAVFRKGEPTTEIAVPSTASVASIVDADDPSVLPLSVVDFSIAPLCTDRMAVLTPCGVNPTHIAELGRVPIWFESNAERFQAKFEDLKRHYEANIPNCEVKLMEQ